MVPADSGLAYRSQGIDTHSNSGCYLGRTMERETSSSTMRQYCGSSSTEHTIRERCRAHADTEVPIFCGGPFFQFSLTSTHIPGVHNVLADDLSRNRLPSFLSYMPNANRTPSLLPTSLLQWLLHPNLDWTSPSWTTLFSSSVLRA